MSNTITRGYDTVVVGDPVIITSTSEVGDCPSVHGTAHGTFYCTRDPHEAGQHVAEGKTTVVAVWPR